METQGEGGEKIGIQESSAPHKKRFLQMVVQFFVPTCGRLVSTYFLSTAGSKVYSNNTVPEVRAEQVETVLLKLASLVRVLERVSPSMAALWLGR